MVPQAVVNIGGARERGYELSYRALFGTDLSSGGLASASPDALCYSYMSSDASHHGLAAVLQPDVEVAMSPYVRYLKYVND